MAQLTVSTSPNYLVADATRAVNLGYRWSGPLMNRVAAYIYLGEYPKAREGFVVCRTPRRFKIAPKITAVPWHEIHSLVEA